MVNLEILNIYARENVQRSLIHFVLKRKGKEIGNANAVDYMMNRPEIKHDLRLEEILRIKNLKQYI